jgi:SAM-dependent methyltransferase
MTNAVKPALNLASKPSPHELLPSSSSYEIKDRIKATYDAIASHYLAWSASSQAPRRYYLQKLLPYLTSKTHASVLELGCGAGVPCTRLLASQPNIHVTANDISHTQLSLAAQNLPLTSVTLVEGDMMNLSFAVGEFDAVVAMYSLIHLPRVEQPALIEKASQWLKTGGWLLVNFGAAEDEWSVEREWLGEEDGVMFWSGWGVERSCEIVREAGLEVRIRDVVSDIEEEGQDVKTVPFLWILAEKVSG